MRSLQVLVLPFLVFGSPISSGPQVQADGAWGTRTQEGCRRCEHRGMLPCGAHSEEILAFEKEVEFCAMIATCERCGGTLLEDCPRCEGGPDTEIAAERRAEIEAWLEPNEIEVQIGRSLPKLDTAFFRLVIDSGDLREGRKKVKQHLLAHQIAHGVEQVAADLNRDFQLEPTDYQSRMRMWIWHTPEDHKQAMTQFLGTGNTGDFKMLGRAPVFSVWTEPEFFATAPAVRTLFVHNAGHMLLSNALAPLWIGDLGGGWLDAAVGHAYEYEVFGRTANYCIEEATGRGNYKDGVWRAAIRKRLGKDKEPVLPRLITRNTGAMEQRDQALCWSFFEYLVHEHQASLRDILKDFKAKKKTREILPARIGMSTIAAEEDWRAWVNASYPKRGDNLRHQDPEK